MRWPSACWLLALSVLLLSGCGGGDSSGGVADSGGATGPPSNAPDGATGMAPPAGMSAPGAMEGAMGGPGSAMGPGGDSSMAGAGVPGEGIPGEGAAMPGMGPPGMTPMGASAGDSTQAYAAGEGPSSAPAYAGNPGEAGMPAAGPYGPAYAGAASLDRRHRERSPRLELETQALTRLTRPAREVCHLESRCPMAHRVSDRLEQLGLPDMGLPDMGLRVRELDLRAATQRHQPCHVKSMPKGSRGTPSVPSELAMNWPPCAICMLTP